MSSSLPSALSTTSRIFVGVAILLGVETTACSTNTTPATPDAIATPDAPQVTAAPVDSGWPRTFSKDGASVTIYQPQVETWENYEHIRFSAAIKAQKSPSEKAAFGSIKVSGRTNIDFSTRTAIVDQLKVTTAFNGTDPGRSASLSSLVLEVLPERETLSISLERLASAIRNPALLQAPIDVPSVVPPIVHCEDPAILVMFLGKPKFAPVKGTSLRFATNTNWDVFFDSAAGRYYLLDDDLWLESPDVLKGPWGLAKSLPPEMSKLPEGDDFADVRGHVPARGPAEGETVKKVFVATEPTEMIVTAGPATYAPVEGTSLLVATNSDSALFFDSNSKQHYFLVAGRWFASSSLDGPWSSVGELPLDFLHLPKSPEFDEVSAAVPRTEESQEAILIASIPRKAMVQRSQAHLEVKWDGEPRFRWIVDSKVEVGVNTPFAIFRVSGKYYCCDRGVWFVSSSATDAYVLCDSVPPAIYDIPPTDPCHGVVYVKVYSATPDAVEMGYTLGYQGAYVLNGCLVFGAGVAIGSAWSVEDEDYWTWHLWVPFYSYGCAAWFNPVACGFYRGCAWYGPYGGVGFSAVYSPWTGAWARGVTRYGPAGYAGGFAAYNPVTDRGIVHAEGGGIYGSWGRTVISTDEGWISAGRSGGPARGVGWVETSEGAAAIGVRNFGDRSFVAKNEDGDIYVGHDGEIYRRDEDGDWSRRDGDDWDRVDRPSSDRPGDDKSPGSRDRAALDKKEPAPATTSARQDPKRIAETREQLERDRKDRALANERAQAYERTKRSGVYGNAAPAEAAKRKSNPSPPAANNPANAGRLGGRVSGGRIGAGTGGGRRR